MADYTLIYTSILVMCCVSIWAIFLKERKDRKDFIEALDCKINEFKEVMYLTNDMQIMANHMQEAAQKMVAGYEHQKNGNLDKAIELYKSAIKVYPGIFNGCAALGYAYLERNGTGDTDSASWQFYRAAELNPNKIEPYNDLARFHATLNNLDECVEYISKMADLDFNSITHLLDDNVILKVVTTDEIIKIYGATLVKGHGENNE